MPNKIVFLDMDGVLNNRTSMYLATVGIYPPKARCKIFTVDHGCVRLFEHLIKSTGAKFVISSSWRKDTVAKSHSVFTALEWAGFTDAKKHCVGVTKHLDITHSSVEDDSPFGRGAEIDEWLSRNPTDNFVILDDDSFDIHQKGNFVKTEHEIGLTVKNMKTAINLLIDF